MPPLNLLQLEPNNGIQLPKEGHVGAGYSRMRIINVSNETVAYKLKSTAPKNYSIKPSQASLKPGETFDVQIVRKPPEELVTEEAPAAASKPRKPDRFLVQAAVVDSPEKQAILESVASGSRSKSSGASKFWEAVAKEDVQEQQLEVELVESQPAVPSSNGNPPPSEPPRPSKEAKEVDKPLSRQVTPQVAPPAIPAAAAVEEADRKARQTAKEQANGKGYGKEAPDPKAAVKDAKGKKGDGKGDGKPSGDNSPPQGPPPGPPPGFVQRSPPQSPQIRAAEAPDSPEKEVRPLTNIKKPTKRSHEDAVINKHTRPVTSVQVSPNGKELYTCAKDKFIFAWSIPEGEFIRPFVGHRGAVWACSVTYDGVLLLSCGADSMVLVWEVASARKLQEVQLPGVARYVEWVPSGDRSLAGKRHFSACHNNFKDRPAQLSIWDAHDLASEPNKLLEIQDLPAPATQVSWTGQNCEVLCSVHDRQDEVIFWHSATGFKLGELDAHEGATSMVSFPDDRNLMASCGRVDMSVKLWDLSSGYSTSNAVLLQVFNTDRPLNAVCLRPPVTLGDVRSASAGQPSANLCACLAGGGQDARDVATVGAGAEDQFEPVTMRLGAGQSLEAYVGYGPETRQSGHFGPIHAFTFSVDGAFCVSGSEDGNVRIRDLAMGSGAVASIQCAAPAQPPATSLGGPRPRVPPPAGPVPIQPKSSPKMQAKTQPKAAVPKVELATQISGQRGKAGSPVMDSLAAANRVIGLYDFDIMVTGWPFGQQQRPLPFSKGQEIEVVQDFGGGWAWGKIGQQQGLFPMNYVLPMPKYQEIMQQIMAKGGAPGGPPGGSPTLAPAKPASPALRPHDYSGGLAPGAALAGMGVPPGMSSPSSLGPSSGFESLGHLGTGGLGTGLGHPASLGGGLGGLGSGLSAGPPGMSSSPLGGSGLGEPMTIGALSSGLLDRPLDSGDAGADGEEEGDCSQS